MRKGFNVFIVFITAAAVFAGCKGKGKDNEGEVLAKVDGRVITMNDFRREQDKLPPYLKASVQSEEGKKQLLENLVTKELILQKGIKAGLDKDESIASKLNDVRSSLIIEAFLKKEIEGKAAFSESEAEAYYNANKDKFNEGEKVRISHIMVKTSEEAEEVLAKLKNKERFEVLAKKHSLGATASKGGDIGYIERGTIVSEFEDVAFGLKNIGDISPVIREGTAFHIIMLTDRKPGVLAPFEKVKEKIIQSQIKKRQKEVFEELVKSLKKEAKITLNEGLLKDEIKADVKPEETPAKKE